MPRFYMSFKFKSPSRTDNNKIHIENQSCHQLISAPYAFTIQARNKPITPTYFKSDTLTLLPSPFIPDPGATVSVGFVATTFTSATKLVAAGTYVVDEKLHWAMIVSMSAVGELAMVPVDVTLRWDVCC